LKANINQSHRISKGVDNLSKALEITRDIVIATITTTKLNVSTENAEDIANYFQIIYNQVNELEVNEN